MTPRQKDRLGLYQLVIKNCDEHPDIVSLYEDFGRYLHGFRTAVAAVELVDYLNGQVRLNKIPAENEFYPYLSKLTEAACNCMLDLAQVNGNSSLQQKVQYTLSHVRVTSRDIRSSSLVPVAETFGEWMAPLTNYGMNEYVLEALNIGIENYLGIGPSLSHIIPQPEAYQECFRNVLHTANLLLRDRIDILMEDMAEEHLLFYQSYRRIRTYGEINYLL